MTTVQTWLLIKQTQQLFTAKHKLCYNPKTEMFSVRIWHWCEQEHSENVDLRQGKSGPDPEYVSGVQRNSSWIGASGWFPKFSWDLLVEGNIYDKLHEDPINFSTDMSQTTEK